MIQIRAERPDDIPAIRLVNEKAFGQSQEANIVDRLRLSCGGLLSLVALVEGRVVGHLLFSPVCLDTSAGTIEGMGLAPMAVLPEYQRQGIGSSLVEEGLQILRGRRCPFVIVLGHPHYYPRFGFQPASRHGVKCQWHGIPDEAFMLLILDPSRMPSTPAVARYRIEFEEAL